MDSHISPAQSFNQNILSIEEFYPSEHEKLLRKLEGEIRSYIKIEHQLKMHAESLQDRVDQLEKENGQLYQKIKHLEHTKPSNKEENKKHEEQINMHYNEINHLKQLVSTYEEHNLKIPELEKKIRIMKNEKDKEIKSIEDGYKSKINTLMKTLSEYEEIINSNQYVLDNSSLGPNNKIPIINKIPINIMNTNKYNSEKQKSTKHTQRNRYEDDSSLDKVNYLSVNNTSSRNNESNLAGCKEKDTIQHQERQRSKSRTHSPDITINNNNNNNGNMSQRNIKHNLDKTNTTHNNYINNSNKVPNQNQVNLKKDHFKTIIEELKAGININSLKSAVSNKKKRNSSSLIGNKQSDTSKLHHHDSMTKVIDQTMETLRTRNDISDINNLSNINKTHRKNDSISNQYNSNNIPPRDKGIKSLISKYQGRDNSSNKRDRSKDVTGDNRDHSQSQISTRQQESSSIKKHNSSKAIHSMKENIQEGKVSKGESTARENHNAPFILNQHGVPCYNNINIYTKNNDINLRHYIFNKVTSGKKSSAGMNNSKSSTHLRSNSTINSGS
jgi:hypothetical protein